MALLGETDFSNKPQLDIASIASLYQKKAAEEQQMKLQQQQMESDKLNRVVSIVNMASSLTQTMTQQAARQQMLAGQKSITDLLGRANDLVPAEGMTPAKSNLFPQLTQAPSMTPATSSLFPNLTAAPTTVPASSTPDFQAAFKKAAFQANPEEASKAIAQETFKPKPPTFQAKNVMVNGTPTVLNYNPETATYHDMQGNPVSGNIQPFSVFNQEVTLTAADRKNAALQAQAKAIVEGRATPAQLANLRTANGQKIVALASELDPNFDISKAAARVSMQQDFTTKGKSGQALVSFNTAIIHSEKLNQQVDDLKNSDFKKYNTVANILKNETGKPEVKRLISTRNLFADEAAKAARGGTGVITEGEVNRMLQEFDEASSPTQLKAVTENMIGLMADKAGVLKDSWNNTMAGAKPSTPFITGKTAVILRRHGINPDTLQHSQMNSSPTNSNMPPGFSYTVE